MTDSSLVSILPFNISGDTSLHAFVYKEKNDLRDFLSSDTIKRCTRRVVYDKRHVFSAGARRWCRAHALVSCARRGGDSRHFILKIKLNWRHSNPSISPSLLRESRRDENLNYFLGSTVRFRIYIFLGGWGGLALDWLIFRHAACNINRKNGLIATIAGWVYAQKSRCHLLRVRK